MFARSELFAQSLPNISIFYGPNLTTLKGAPFNDRLYTISRSLVGVSYQFQIKNNYSIRTYLAFEKKGVRQTDLILLDTSKTIILDILTPKSKFNYLSVPIIFNYTVGKKVKYAIGIGGYAAYLINIKDILEGLNTPKITTKRELLVNNRLDLGLSFSSSIAIPISKRLSGHVNLLYNRGIRSFAKTSITLENPVYTSSANLLFGISYSILH